jgi:hypothetical protein
MLISDMAHYTFLANLKPGLTEEEVSNKAVDVLNSHGIGDRIILIHSRPEATYPNRPGLQVIKTNPVTYSPNSPKPGLWSPDDPGSDWWEKPKGTYKTMFELWAEMRQNGAEEFGGVRNNGCRKKIEDLVEIRI